MTERVDRLEKLDVLAFLTEVLACRCLEVVLDLL